MLDDVCACESHALVPQPSAALPAERPLPDLDDRAREVVLELARSDGRTAFAGLRRRLGLHQQALTRTLRRLEREGVVERDDAGYALTDDAAARLGAFRPRALAGPMLPVLQALLPPSVTADDVAQRLSRRWFRELRWHGRADAPGETSLSWLTTGEGSLVRVRFAGGVATVEVEVPDDRTLDSLPAAQALLRAVADLYGPTDTAA